MADAGEPLQVGRVKAEEIGILGGFDHYGSVIIVSIFVSGRRLSGLHGTCGSALLWRHGNLHESDADDQFLA
jgi:hypothetical protein